MDQTWNTGALSSCCGDTSKFAQPKNQPVVMEVVVLNSVRYEDPTTILCPSGQCVLLCFFPI